MQNITMTTIQTNIEIQPPVEQVFEFYTNPDNIKESWPRDIVKESSVMLNSLPSIISTNLELFHNLIKSTFKYA